jgi:hypothetical protein
VSPHFFAAHSDWVNLVSREKRQTYYIVCGLDILRNRSFGFSLRALKCNFETEDRTHERWKIGVAETEQVRKKVFMVTLYFDLSTESVF